MKKSVKIVIAGLLLLGMVACSSGVSREEYEKLVSERDALAEQLRDMQAAPDSDAEPGLEYDTQTSDESSALPSREYNADDVIKKLEVKEYTWKNTIDTYYLALAVENKSDFDTDLSCSTVFYDSQGNMIGAADDDQVAVAAGSKTLFVFNNEAPFDKYSYDFEPSEVSYYACVAQNLEYEQNIVSGKVVISVTNAGAIPVEYPECHAIFMSGDRPVNHNSTFCMDDDSELKPGKTRMVELSAYEEFDSVELFFTGRGDPDAAPQKLSADKRASGSQKEASFQSSSAPIDKTTDEAAPAQSFPEASQETNPIAPSLKTIDWDKCTSDAKQSLISSASYVKDVAIIVDEEKKIITFSAVLTDSTAPAIALDFADSMIRQFNLFANIQDNSIALGNKDSFGGLYDTYTISIGVAPLSKVDDPSKWFIHDAIAPGIQTKHKIKLQQPYQ